MLTIALSKGRLLKSFLDYLNQNGHPGWYDALTNAQRELLVEKGEIRFLLVKGDDVPTYVEEGIADLGITGSDILAEQSSDVNELLKLPFGHCHFAIASKEELPAYRTIATKYVNVTRDYFDQAGQPVKIIKLNGSVELAAVIGMADAIVDIVQSGETLRMNGLEERIQLDEISARLVANKHAFFTKSAEIRAFINELQVN
ncbi:ATP phosphoribosyltransferase [Planococcus lenghuensis]|uniref:ATP phosphoribosyltransferase n=1 Tax=Planococcus lenghuensis TaxID=2213202 RepID=A0A1Q2L245_9BACL|nr:ATP phosphoribosyltransferase [Planococcus lenghuensis]AQQ54509.1 ATP phosphoribosyltransferase [Planococcus lenghuensis]